MTAKYSDVKGGNVKSQMGGIRVVMSGLLWGELQVLSEMGAIR